MEINRRCCYQQLNFGTCSTDCFVQRKRSSDADGTIASYSWDFGDSTNATGVRKSYLQLSWDLYCSIDMTDDDGAMSSTTVTITVTAPVPAARV